ncbi:MULTISPECIES: pseudouridine synthase [Hyphobacterium]|uniref:Pseudouridine synthase n=1 Tax=Hyphobacterium vulgare TaxID=1736751 RepID=A0ABV6ZYK9_9PROT
MPEDGERIAKVLARAGVASRREVEAMIEAGRITLNGKPLTTPAVKVTDRDRITVDGQPVGEAERTRLWRYHKPDGLVTTHKDPQGRETVFEKLPKEMGRVISVGRLDLTSEGLLLLTNDGELARALELPATGWTRRYRCRAFGDLTDDGIAKLRKGITAEGVHYGPIEVEVERKQGGNVWLLVSLKEGKNREVRKALNAVGLTVNRLIRTAYGPFQLGSLDKGEVASVNNRVLVDQCGHLLPKLKDQTGDDPASGQARAKAPARKKPPMGDSRKTGGRPARTGPAKPKDSGKPQGSGKPQDAGQRPGAGKPQGAPRGKPPARSGERPSGPRGTRSR